ncbi:uncharacterized protein DUF2314 [Dysgonomonas alginatilytica]|uniref:Uncharacterized protein DUF2314 n=1 Tax=Dysgonomonas alginatilytica TaxID=1605892 RepID=A0A2V3PKN7_9BACT|nr:DUF4026 domain-containing protein [Dysgonomonas alginatilytica]PXV61020.1 uncharacterized protein DUF2314 [Dysgonomonas alginatilytica]
MENDHKYKLLSEGEIFQPSIMGVISSKQDDLFTQDYINDTLSRYKGFNLLSFELSQANDHVDKEYIATIEYLEEVYRVVFSILSVEDLRLEEFGLANMVNEDDINTALSQKKHLNAAVNFSSKPLDSFHLQLKILAAVAPDASLVIDFMSFRLLSGKWLDLTASSTIPPSPDYLYALHAVYDEKDEKTEYWFHTHGLVRCGFVEIEILNTTNGAQQMYDLVNHTVKRFLSDPVKEHEKFTAGFDGLDISLTWIRWEEALKDYKTPILGGFHDREGDSNAHSEPSGVLFAIEDGILISPEIYASTLANNPILFVSTEETLRMSRLAKDRFSYFLRIFEKHAKQPTKSFFKRLLGKKEENENQWSFIVKFGLIVDNANNNTEREHLWFRAISADSETVEGKLLNAPYWIASLKEGDIKSYPIEVLTDWIIYDAEGNQYTPDSVYQLIDEEDNDD